MGNIRNLITASYMALAVVILVLLGFLINGMVQSHFLGEAQRNLMRQGENIARLFATEMHLRGFRSPASLMDERLRLWSRTVTAMIESDFIVLSTRGDILAASQMIPLPDDASERLALDPIARTLQTREPQTDQWESAEGEPLVVGVFPITLHGNRSPVAVLIAFQEVTVATGAARDVGRIVMQTAVVALLLAFGLSLVLGRRVSRPIEELSEVARALGRGEMDRRAPEKYADEFAHLARRMNQMAEQLSAIMEERRAFTASISHELRTPVTSIKGFVQALRDGLIGAEEQDQYLDTVLAETRRIERLLDDLLQLQRLEAGQLSMHYEWVPARSLVERAGARVTAALGERTILVSTVDKTGGAEIWVDEERIDQVLGSLLDNAARHAPCDSTVQVGACLDSDPEDEIRMLFWVADEGPGLAEDQTEIIFDRFYRGEDRSHEGMGLGLAISREIIHEHGGTIWAHNRPGGGAIFRFTINRVRDGASIS